MKNRESLRLTKVQKILVLLSRLFVGGLFIFSGLVKAIDPWGGLYKITEYFAAMHIAVSHETTLVLACVLACAEFVSGVLLMLGSFRRTVVWFLSAFMLVMTSLTLWIYVSDPVSDCGCFGDAVVLSNGATLAKNLVLCAFVAYLAVFNHRVRGTYHYHLQWLVLVASVFYAVSLSLIGYFIQPIVDFRPFKVGTNLEEALYEQDAPLLVYEKDGVKKTFDANDLPGDDWTFVARQNKHDDTLDFAVFDGEDDVTEDLLDESNDGGLLLLCVSHPNRYGISRSRMANRLFDIMQKNDGAFVAVLPSASDSVEQRWINDVEANYAVYTADDTDIKSMVRGDAALVYIKDKVIKWKYNVYALSPEIKGKNEALSVDELLKIKPIEEQSILLKLTLIYLSVMFGIWLLASLPLMLYKHRAAKNESKVQLDE